VSPNTLSGISKVADFILDISESYNNIAIDRGFIVVYRYVNGDNFQIMILTPIFLPIIQSAGIDPVYFGVLFVIACEIGFETPPLGANLYGATELVDTTIEEMSAQALNLHWGRYQF